MVVKTVVLEAHNDVGADPVGLVTEGDVLVEDNLLQVVRRLSDGLGVISVAQQV
jgi:hypothetical protein